MQCLERDLKHKSRHSDELSSFAFPHPNEAVLQHAVVDHDIDPGQGSAPWWTAHQASDAHVERFLQLLAGLSKAEWQSIRPRSKDTKVYSTAIQEIERLKSLYPEKAKFWARVRAEASGIARRNASWGRSSPYELADAAADAAGALVIMFPWGHSFERLYGPLSDVIPLKALDPETPTHSAHARILQTASPPIPPRLQPPVDYGRAAGFFGGEFLVVGVWLLLGIGMTAQMGPASFIVSGMPAAAMFFALKVSRGPIASINIVRYGRRLSRLRATDNVTYDFVVRARQWVTLILAMGAILELVAVVALFIAARHSGVDGGGRLAH
jgi:hypothetical protein